MTTSSINLYASASIPTTKTEIVSALSNTKRVVRKASFVNNNASAVTVDLYINPDGINEIHLLYSKVIGPYETYSVPDIEGHDLEADGTISVTGSTTNIELIITGFYLT